MSPNMPSKYKLIGFSLNNPIVSFVHERLFQLSGRNSIFDLYEISKQDFDENIDEVLHENGLDVSAPYRQEIIGHLDKIDEKASLYNAVDATFGKKGYHTESFGFLQAIHSMGAHLYRASVLIYGVGDYAKMAAIEATLAGAKLTLAITKEQRHKAELLRESLMNINASTHITVVDVTKLRGAYQLIINASPVGMAPHLNECLISPEVVEQADFVFDFVCNPPQTQLLKLAEKYDVCYSNGVPMLVWQAVATHCIWYNADFNAETVAQLIDETQAILLRNFEEIPSARACQV